MTILEWEKEYVSIGQKEGYSEDQIKEYLSYINICKQLQEALVVS